MDKRLFIIMLSLLRLSYAGAQAGKHQFINYSAKDGLPDKFVYCAAQDNRGYMWFGTGSGLYRYDGHRFVHFNSKADLPGHSINNVLRTILKDDAGHLWLGSLNTLQLFNPATGTFWKPDFSKGQPANVENAGILNISQSGSGHLWLSTQFNYFFRFNRSDSSFTHFNQYPPGASKTVIRVFEQSGNIYAVHSEGIYVFTATGKPVHFCQLPGDVITNAAEDRKAHRLLCATGKSGIVNFDFQSGTFRENTLNNDRLKGSVLFCLRLSPDGAFIYAGSYNFGIIDAGSGQYDEYRVTNQEFDLGVTKIADIFTDRENNVWLCSHFGLSMMPWQNNQVEKFALLDKVSGNGVEPINAFADLPRNEILITNTNSAGLVIYHPKEKKVSTIINHNNLHKNISSLIAAPDGKWFAGDGDQLYEYLPSSRQLKPFPLTDQQGRNITQTGRTVVDQQGRIYMESISNGFYTWDYPSPHITHYNKWDIDTSASALLSNKLAPCFADSKNNIWFTSDNGVYRYDATAAAWHLIGDKEQNKVPPISQSNHVAEDRSGHIWISSVVNGLYEWYHQDGKEVLRHYNRNSGAGLPSDFCWQIQLSPVDSSLWINSLNGLLKFDPVSRQVTSRFTKQNGLSEDNGGYTFAVLPGNKLVQLFYASMNIIDLAAYQENRFLPEVQFNSVKVLDREYAAAVKDGMLSLELDHRENFLQFEFAALVFNNANRNRYAWQLAGFDTAWVYGGFTNQASYNSLKPGRYVFRVKAANSDGYWGNESRIQLVILPPMYARWWFILLGAALLTGSIYGVYKRNIARARREEQLKADFQRKIAETEMKALRAQMNPHFIFNSLNSIQKFILQNDQFNASHYLTRFSRLIRLILDHSNQGSILLSGELELLRLYIEIESMRFNGRFESAIIVDDNIRPDSILIPSMLIQPFVENAIWHGLLHKEEKGNLTLHFSLHNDRLTVTVDDDGIGREKARAWRSKQVLTKKSYGMQITQDRIAMINQLQGADASCTITDKTDTRGQAAGTRVEIHIPVKPLKN